MPDRPTSNWKRWAAEAEAEGHKYSEFQAMLDQHLRQLFPVLVKELEATGDYPAYLVVKAADAGRLEATMLAQGTHPLAARELMMDELLPKPPDEEDRPTKCETEGAQADMMAGAFKFLMNYDADRK